MSKIDYQALREKAEKATCGVWSLEYGESRFDGDDALIHREVAGYIPICRIEGAHPESGFDEDFQMEQQANAEFIAASNPATVLTLLDELETAKKRIAELEAEPVRQTYKLPQTQFEQVADLYEMQFDDGRTCAFHTDVQKAAQWLQACDGNRAQEYVKLERLRNALSGNSPVTPDGWVMVPKKLTAENGAKGVLSGEFSETTFISCPECFGDDDCDTCDGSGRIEIKVPVTWTTIKSIWDKGIAYFAAEPPQEVNRG
ncbi:TPA: ead/Ea22-like family protein [Escherichia coli]